MRQSMTYGTLPNKSDFFEAFEAECPNGVYKITNCKRVGNDNFTNTRLWDELVKANRDFLHGDDEAGDWASCVLYTLGFEWI